MTPPRELYKQWEGMPRSLAFEAAYRAGADQELEACCEWMVDHFHGMKDWSAELRATRRPKPPSLAERALDAQRRMWDGESSHADWGLIRAALERLQELESNG